MDILSLLLGPRSTTTTTTGATRARNHLHYMILCKDVLLGEYHIRHTDFNVSFPSFRPRFTGTTGACVIKYNHGMVQQPLMESRGDPVPTLNIILDFMSEYWQKHSKLLKCGPAKRKNKKEGQATSSITEVEDAFATICKRPQIQTRCVIGQSQHG